MSFTNTPAAHTFELQAAVNRAEDDAREAAIIERNAAQAAIGGRVFRVVRFNLDSLTKRVEKINRRAVKLGVEPIILTVTDESFDREVIENGKVKEVISYVFVVLSQNTVKLNGYQFAATIEHDEDGNVVRTVPGVEGDFIRFRTAPALCEHCNTIRRRNDTFVVLHEDGHTKQVGRNCLVDFLGSDAMRAAQVAEWMIELEDAAESAERDFTGGAAVRVYDLAEFLTHVALMIRENGWVSKSAASDYKTPTAILAESNMNECIAKQYREPQGWGRDADWHVLPSAEDREAADAAIAWAREHFGSMDINERSDFDHNMAVATAKDFLPTRRTGLAAYAVQAHRKAIEVEVTKQAKAVSSFVGSEGEKITVQVTVSRIVELADRYSFDGGTKPLYLMVDGNGNTIKWFASNYNSGMKAGESYTVTGTVKRHEDDAQYGKATLLTRCKAA